MLVSFSKPAFDLFFFNGIEFSLFDEQLEKSKAKGRIKISEN
jgi:hypothetical protein